MSCVRCGRGFGRTCSSFPYCPPNNDAQQQARADAQLRGLAVRCTTCDAYITLPRVADTVFAGQALRAALLEQGATAGPVNPLTGYAPLRCRACSGVQVHVAPAPPPPVAD